MKPIVLAAVLLLLAFTAGCTLEVNESPPNRPAVVASPTTRFAGTPDFVMNMTPGTERVRVHFRRDILGAEGAVGLSVPGRRLDIYTVAGTLVSRGDTWVRLISDEGRTVDIPTVHVLAILSDPDRDELPPQ